MNHGRLALAVTAFCLGSLPASAVPPAKTLLTSPLQSMQQAGFQGLEKASVPEAPATAVPIPMASGPDAHAKEVLAAFAQEILQKDARIPLSGKSARKLGFTPTAGSPDWNSNGDMTPKAFGRRNSSTGETKGFSAIDSRGKTEIIITYLKDSVEVRHYLVSTDGVLVAAVRETPDGTVTNIPSAQAQNEFDVELGFWVRYYDKTHPK